MKLISIPQDKLLHAYAGVLIYCLSALVMTPLYAILVVVLAGMLKEVYDLMNRDKHTPDAYDALATVTGAMPVFILQIIKEM